MPLYEFKCSECLQKFEYIRPYKTRSTPLICPLCGTLVEVSPNPPLVARTPMKWDANRGK